MYEVVVTYFKQTGKYYSEGAYKTEKQEPYEIFAEVRNMFERGDRPGLVSGRSNEFFAVVNLPNHPYGYPALIIPDGVYRMEALGVSRREP